LGELTHQAEKSSEREKIRESLLRVGNICYEEGGDIRKARGRHGFKIFEKAHPSAIDVEARRKVARIKISEGKGFRSEKSGKPQEKIPRRTRKKNRLSRVALEKTRMQGGADVERRGREGSATQKNFSRRG